MTRWFTVFAILFFGLMGILRITTASENVFRYLKAPDVKWENEQLTGEFHNVPLNELLEELAMIEGFQIVIFGDLGQVVTLSIDHLSIEETIKRIQRQTKLNYIMIFNKENSTQSNRLARIEKLLVFGNSDDSTTAVSPRRKMQDQNQGPKRRSTDIERENLVPPATVPEPSNDYADIQDKSSDISVPESDQLKNETAKPISEKPKVQFEGNRNDLKSFVETLSKENRINAEEYEMILEKMKSRTINP